MNELPKGWGKTQLNKIVPHDAIMSDGDWVESKDQDPNGSIRLIQLADIGDGDFRNKSQRYMNEEAANRLSCSFLKEGDLLVARMPDPLGRACLFPNVGQKAVTVVDVCFIRETSISAIPNTLLKHWFNSPYIRGLISANASGSTRKRITRKKLEKFEFPVPPLAEQKRIVEKLDEVLAQVDTIKARLDGIPDLLKRFRQSVLASAVSGKLTEEWRDRSNCLAEIDLQHELLKNTTKPRKVEQTSNHELVVDKFPSNWEKSTFTELYKFIDYRGKTPKKSEHGYRLYTAKNIKMGFVSNEPIEYLSESDYEAWMTRGFSRLGDIFFVTEGHTMGCTAINELGSEIALAQRTLTLQPYGNVNTKFHKYYMMSDSFQKLVDLNATGSAAKGIKAAKFRGLPLPFPSYAEQKEIVRLVDQYFAFADIIKAQVKKAQARVDILTQSILAKAFRGELVAQDPTDEPADKLLERIAEARKEAEALAKAAKKAEAARKKAEKAAVKG